MKKIVIFLAFIASSLVLPAQDSTKLTAKSVYEDVKQGFSSLVNNLQGPAKHVYEVYVYQQRATGLGELIVFVILSVVFTVGFFISHKKANWDEGNPASVATIVSCIFLLACVIFALVQLPEIITKISNPEYHAIEQIVNNFTK